MRRFGFAIVVAGAVLVGVVAQAGSYLLALAPFPVESDVGRDGGSSFAERGIHSVGVRVVKDDEAPLRMTLWYPAVEDPRGSTATYSYGISMLGAGTSTALATYDGYAQVGAAADSTDGPYPLVVLSHGFGVTPTSYGWLAEHLASHGLVVVAPHHREPLDPGSLWKSTIERPQDIGAVLDHMDAGGGDLEGLVDDENVAVVGHSYGGYTALAAAGAQIDTRGLQDACDTAYRTDDPLVFLCDALLPNVEEMAELAGLDSVPTTFWPSAAWDSQVDAVVSMAGDAFMFAGDGLASLDVPVMALGGTADTDSPFEWGTRLTYDQVSSERKIEVAFEGAAHMVFAGECERVRRIMSLVSLGFCTDPAWDRDLAHWVVKHHVTAFLLAELADSPTARAALGEGGLPPDVGYRSEGY